MLEIAALAISCLWLSYTALNLYKNNRPRELYSLYMNTAGIFYLAMVAAWVLMFLFVFSGGFKDIVSTATPMLTFLLPFFLIISIGAASQFMEKSTDRVGFVIVVGTFLWQLSTAISSTMDWAMFALGGGYFFVGTTMLLGGSFLGGLLGNIYPETERKMREWLQTPDSDDAYGNANALWRWQAKNTPAEHAASIAQMKQSHFPSSQVVQIFIFSFWSIAYAVAAETIGKDPAFFAQVGKDPIPIIFGPLFGLIFVFFACIIIYAIMSYLKGKQMALAFDKQQFALGENITGSVILKLGKPKQARGLRLEFYGVEHVGRGKGGSNRVICQSGMELSPARMYQSGETIPFSISMPAGVKEHIILPQGAGMLERMSRANSRILWYVKATLDLPGEIDLTQAEKVGIAVPAESQPAVAAAMAENKSVRQKMFWVSLAIFLIFTGGMIFQFATFSAPGTSGKQASAPAADAQIIKGYKMKGDIPYGFTPPPMQVTLPDTIEINGSQYALAPAKYVSANPYNDGKTTRTIWVVKVETDDMAIPASHAIDVYMDLTIEGGIARASNFRAQP